MRRFNCAFAPKPTSKILRPHTLKIPDCECMIPREHPMNDCSFARDEFQGNQPLKSFQKVQLMSMSALYLLENLNATRCQGRQCPVRFLDRRAFLFRLVPVTGSLVHVSTSTVLETSKSWEILRICKGKGMSAQRGKFKRLFEMNLKFFQGGASR